MKWKAFLLHLTHYDPVWLKTKDTEKRFDRKTAEALIHTAAESGFNMLIIDIKDAVLYKSLPHLKKRYTVPMRELKELTSLGRKLGLEVVPKLNFSKSPEHRHSHWLWAEQCPPDSPASWKDALKAIDEIIGVMKPGFLHVGMDEDDTRSPDEYKRALHFLYRQLKKRNLHMMMWADCGHRWRPAERWKVVPAIETLPRDVILMPWSYDHPLEDWTRKFMRWGFEVIGAASCIKPKKARKKHSLLKNTREWMATIEKTRALGIIVTQWTQCSRENAANMLKALRSCKRLLQTAQ
ncbi:MAG: hypothetical protein C0404_14465 [Verrucomicrobia bacterium]|nr:hypothetical protein [Verrucomicrobiota bacterium]